MSDPDLIDHYDVGLDDYASALRLAGADVHHYKEFGSYQGDWLAKVTFNSVTGWVHDYFGSCSGCDELQAALPYDDKTRAEWQAWALVFCADYLSDIKTYDEVLKEVSRDAYWSLEDKEMVEWLEAHK